MKISLPRELDEWVQARADQIGVEPELIIQQIIDSHRTGNVQETAEPMQETGLNRVLLESIIERKLDQWVEDELDDRVEEDRERWVEEELDDRIEQHREEWLEEEFDATLEDRLDETQWLSGELVRRLDDRLEDRLEEWTAAELQDRVDGAVERALEERLDRRVDAALEDRRADLDDRLSALEDDHMEKIRDLRERVVQVKRETDRKAPAEDLEASRERIEDLSVTLETARDRVAELADRLEDAEADLEGVDDLAERVEDLGTELGEATERLNTLGWHVTQLDERAQVQEELEELRERAAELTVSQATCETCSSTVDLGLLTEPECPHCGATAEDVEAAGWFFGSPRLLTSPR